MNHRIESMKPSASMVLMARAKEMQKTDPTVIGLAGGEPDFATPDRISMAAIRSLTEGYTHYVVGPGLPELRQAIQKKLREENGLDYDVNCIMVTPGGKNAIYLAVQAILNEGDEVMVLDPAWVSYEPIIQAAGGVTVKVKLDYQQDYRITAEALEAVCTDKTRLIIINYPNNPTGRILHKDEADILEAFMLRHPQVYMLSDEVYEKLVYDGAKSISMGAYPSIHDRVATMNGFSKSAAMTGWRMGYLAAPKAIYDVAYKLYQHSLSCMSGFLQKGAVEAFSCEYETEQMRKTYAYRRDMFTGALNKIPGVRCLKPEGAFYAWVFFDIGGMDSTQMCEYLLENAGVVGTPGSGFGPSGEGYFRLTVAPTARRRPAACASPSPTPPRIWSGRRGRSPTRC